jgi:hypothetical protein
MICAGTLGAIALYRSTKESYQAVGFNNGMIAGKMEILNRINARENNIRSCDAGEIDERNKIVEVKAWAIYAVRTEASTLKLCIAG